MRVRTFIVVVSVVLGLGASTKAESQASADSALHAVPPLGKYEGRGIIAAVQHWRERSMPPADYDWCAIPAAYDSAEAISANELLAVRIVARTRAACVRYNDSVKATGTYAKGSGDRALVTLYSMQVFTDSIVIRAGVDFRRTGICERYSLRRMDRVWAVGMRELRQTCMVVED